MKKYFIRKYKFQGMYSDWKEISKEVAEKKAKISVYDRESGLYHCPYEIKIVSVD
jgi:hypothetical protein